MSDETETPVLKGQPLCSLPHPATPFLRLVLEQIRAVVLELSAATGLCDPTVSDRSHTTFLFPSSRILSEDVTKMAAPGPELGMLASSRSLLDTS